MWLLALVASAQAASLDLLEVGGVWGSPVATNPTAVWWNPASLARTPGTQVFVEGDMTVGAVKYARDDAYNGGNDTYRLSSPVPYVGVSSDFGIPGLGAGASLVVPFARGGHADSQPEAGPGSFALRDGDIRAIYGMAALAYAPKNLPVSAGFNVAFVHSTWAANLDSELTTSLDTQITSLGQQSNYDNTQIEDQNYAANLDFPTLSDNRFTWGGGLRGDFDPVVVSLAYQHGVHVENTGDAILSFGCPPQSDTVGRFGAESYGLCNTTLLGHAVVSYQLPSRIQGAFGFTPNDHIAATLMFGYVFWSSYSDFDITVKDVETLNELDNPDTAPFVNQHRLWARDNIDTYWVGADVKGNVGDQWVIGGRILYDRSAIPNNVLSPNNFDANSVSVSPMVAYSPLPWLRIGLSGNRTFFQTREVDDSKFAVTLDPATRNEDRYFYPQMNGVYSGGITKVGLVLSGRFGGLPDTEQAPF